MPRHRQVTTCRHGGPTTNFCGCEHCELCVCAVCGAYEGALTTDCPGEAVPFDKRQEVYETNLDFTVERGWHQGNPKERRSPRFEKAMPVLPSGLLGQPTGVAKADLDLVVTELSKIVGVSAVDPSGDAKEMLEQLRRRGITHVPRWTGDTNFMPMIANTKVLSDSLNATYKLFKRK
jgi:hypothetical protein